MLSPLVVPFHEEALPCFTQEEGEREKVLQMEQLCGWMEAGKSVGEGVPGI